MAPSAISQRRTRNLLLLQKLLNLRDGASPFTLLLDTLEQSAHPLVHEFMVRAKVSKTKIIFVSFQSLHQPELADVFIRARSMQLAALRHEITSQIPASQNPATRMPGTGALLIIDTLYPLVATSPSHLSTFLSSLLSPSTSVLATYHTDVPISPGSSSSSSSATPYSPDPLAMLTYLATSIIRVSSLSHTIEKKRARDRSLQEPVFGLEEGKEGVLIGIRGVEGTDGLVMEMEVRRKSGRGVREMFVISTSTATTMPNSGEGVAKAELGGKLCLLDDHPLYAPPAPSTMDMGTRDGGGDGNAEDAVETTFSLGLTEKQRRDREGVVLPYFDAQKGEGSGEGGRILYEMDRGDDFDEEEDEI